MLQKPNYLRTTILPPPARLDLHEQKGQQRTRSMPMDQFTTLYETYAQRIQHYINYRLADEKQAEDITSQVFLRAWEKRFTYIDTGAPPLSWLYAIARNAVIDDRRTYKEVEPIDEVDKYVSDEADPATVCESNNEVEFLIMSLKKLTPDQQQVVVWKFIDDLTTEEIAQKMGKQPGSVRALQMRALKSLSNYLEEYERVENFQ